MDSRHVAADAAVAAGLVPLSAAVDESLFGGKAVSLGAAIRAGLPVPTGIVLAWHVVDRVARQGHQRRP